MNRYWDFDDKQTADLTEEQVEAMLSIELMEKGVQRVDAPELRTVEDIRLATRECFRIHYKTDSWREGKLDIAFETMEQAKSFLDLNPMMVEHEYNIDHDHTKPMLSPAVQPEQLSTEQEILNHKSELEKAKEARDYNSGLSREYDEARKKINEAVGGIWEDWHRCLELKSSMEKIRATFDEYGLLTKGDDDLARKFLNKIYSNAQIEVAEQWHGIRMGTAEETEEQVA